MAPSDNRAALHPYHTYLSSGVQWLGDVPEHWDVVQLGRIGVFSKGSGGTKEDEVPHGIPCVRYGDLYTTHEYFVRQTRSYVSPAKASAYTQITRGDVLFPTSGETIEEIGKSAVNLLDSQVLCGGDLIVFRPTIPIEPKFAGYALDCPAAQTQKSLMGRGITIMHIYSGQIKYLWLPLPPLPEQAAIVRYLDHADQRIRRYVTAKRKLIALLEEEKQAIVNQAVTRGLDPNVRLKPSGVEWLGDVPEHWEVKKVTHMFSIGSGTTPPTDHPEFYGGDVDWITTSELRESIVTSTQKTVTREALRLFPALKIYPAGSVAVAMYGATIGRVGVLGTFAAVNQACCVFSDCNSMNTWFWFYWLNSRRHVLVSMGYGGGQPNLSLELLRSIRVATPSLLEQTAIVEHLDKATAAIDAAIVRARRQIELLQEYRTRLIADVVTGKVDVREAAAQLPDEADDQDPVEERGPLADGPDEVLYDIDESVEELAMESEVTA